jgi:hypothetical protein
MRLFMNFAVCLAIVVTIGCSAQTASTNGQPEAATPAIDGSQYLLTSKPEDAATVIAARRDAKDGEPVVLVGRIGGSANPWIAGRAAFSIVDESLKACSDIPGDECPQPWDYCCETYKLPTATALIKVVDDSGSLVPADAKQLLNVVELSTVVVQGIAQRDDVGNLTVLADGIFIKK